MTNDIEIYLTTDDGTLSVSNAFSPTEQNCLAVMYAPNLVETFAFTTTLASYMLTEYANLKMTLHDVTDKFEDKDPDREPLCAVESVEDGAISIDENVKMYAVIDITTGSGYISKTSDLQPERLIPVETKFGQVTGRKYVVRLYDEFDGTCVRRPALTVPDMGVNKWIDVTDEKPLDDSEPI